MYLGSQPKAVLPLWNQFVQCQFGPSAKVCQHRRKNLAYPWTCWSADPTPAETAELGTHSTFSNASPACEIALADAIAAIQMRTMIVEHREVSDIVSAERNIRWHTKSFEIQKSCVVNSKVISSSGSVSSISFELRERVKCSKKCNMTINILVYLLLFVCREVGNTVGTERNSHWQKQLKYSNSSKKDKL